MVPASPKGRNGVRGGHVGVPLTAGLAARLRSAAAGRAPVEALFLQSDGQPWRDGDHQRPFAKAAAAAGVDDTTNYSLRHSSIARMLLRGLPIRLVAELHNTSTPIIETH
jgi:site-specific recombinase XerD